MPALVASQWIDESVVASVVHGRMSDEDGSALAGSTDPLGTM